MGALSSIKRRWWRPQIQGACSIQAMNGSRPGSRGSTSLEASSRLTPNQPSSQAQKPTHPSKRPGPNCLLSNGGGLRQRQGNVGNLEAGGRVFWEQCTKAYPIYGSRAGLCELIHGESSGR
ncbi:hypothetical protein O181_121048 [Austropuccinia psidii MF-1]|uniref:Uncharacterized protein n=1 Tax=Austropuccinia psidii MF-1 TaxID=1389203 RepID=A0A9Q3KH67_9BASI|nr:hypothetical protein [Austropuccinia psidii MF-1]